MFSYNASNVVETVAVQSKSKVCCQRLSVDANTTFTFVLAHVQYVFHEPLPQNRTFEVHSSDLKRTFILSSKICQNVQWVSHADLVKIIAVTRIDYENF